MPSRVARNQRREESPGSDSERSFVSAASEKRSNWSDKETPIGQSAAVALPSLPPHSAIAPSNFTPTSLTAPNATNVQLDFSPRVQIPLLSSSKSSKPPTPLAPQLGSYFALQPGASGSEARSPQNRRPPASRSSHGIETSSGPPPALSTRRSYNAEPPWRIPPPNDLRSTRPPMVHSASIDSVATQSHHIANGHIEPKISEAASSAPPRKPSMVGVGTVAMDEAYGVQSGSEEDQDSTLRINGHKEGNGRHPTKENGRQQSPSSPEDLFLNLARADSVIDDGPETSNWSERRLSRIRGSSLQQPRESQPPSSHRPSTSVGGFGQQFSPLQHGHYESSFDSSIHRPSDKILSSYSRDSLARSRSYAASAHPLDQRRGMGNTRKSFGGLTRDGPAQDRSSELPLGGGRQRSIREAPTGLVDLAYNHSNQSLTPNDNYKSSYFPVHHGQGEESDQDLRTPHAEDTESTVSTTAPSTVWDELEDMKFRIRKLEITGKLPVSSNAAMSNTFRERPPTATTTMATTSLSPKRRHLSSVSPESSTIIAPEVADVHPLLHSALAKTKSSINANLYKALEATASDALTLAAMAGSASAHGVSPSAALVAGTSVGLNRHLRRKADNMCRSLTELCIALAEENSETEIAISKTRQGSKDVSAAAKQTGPSLQDLRSFRATSDEPEFRSSSRVMSRLEARRTSLALGSSPLSHREPSQEAPMPTQAAPPPSSRLDRTSSVIHYSHASDNQGDITTSRRPPSRATTEIGQTRSSPQTRISREYTSQHPMPNLPQRSPSVQSSLPTRKNYFPPVSRSPLTPDAPPGNRRYLDRSTPPSSADSSRLAEARQRRIASLGQHTSAGPSRIGIASGRLRHPEAEQ